MQASGEKLAQKSNKIAQTPIQGSLAEIMPIAKNSGREQAYPKQSKQCRKKELADFFGQGPQVPAPLRKGTPIDAVVKQMENRMLTSKTI
jgi:hypothetical protein